MKEFKTYKYNKSFELESGKNLPDLHIAYHSFGTLNEKKDNVIWICHALTGNSDASEWWEGMVGPNRIFNANEHFIICPNVLGSPYGTSSPASRNPATEKPFCLSFPQYTTRDMARVHQLLADHLEITQIKLLIGGSLGGQQASEWAIAEPKRIQHLVLIATNAYHSPWGIAFNESQRLAINADPTFKSESIEGGRQGLKAARSMALLSYRTYETYGTSQQETSTEITDDFKASSYQKYQGEKLINRFDAYSYWYLSKAMDSHNLARGRGTIEDALKYISAKTLVIGITSDLLFPPEEQKFLAQHISNARYAEINSFYGHDGFLIETEILTKEIGNFLKNCDVDNLGILDL